MSLPTQDKDRKALPLWTFLMEYFPDTFLAVANVSIAGNIQHNPGEPLHWAREKSTDQLNTAFRHLWDHGRGTVKDIDGQYHLAKAIWRLSAELQLLIEKEHDPRSKSEDGSEGSSEEAARLLAHARAEWDGLAGTGFPCVLTDCGHPGDGWQNRGAVRGGGDEAPRGPADYKTI